MNTPKQNRSINRHTKKSDSLEERRILILAGDYEGEEGICLGRIAGTNRWAISPDSSNAILELQFESEFALLDRSATIGGLTE